MLVPGDNPFVAARSKNSLRPSGRVAASGLIPTPAYLCARLSYKFTGGPLPAPPRQAVRQSVEVKLLAEEGGSCTSWSAASGGPSRNAACAGAGSSDSSTAWIQTSQQSCPAHASQGAHPFRQPKSGQPLVATAALRRDPPARGERHEEPEPGRKQGGGWMSGRASPPLATTDPRGDGMMQTVTAPGASARITIAVQSMV